MNVLPSNATLASFFIVLACIMVSTVFITANLGLLSSTFQSTLQGLRKAASYLSLSHIAMSVDMVLGKEHTRLEQAAWIPSKRKPRPLTSFEESHPLLGLVVGLFLNMVIEWPRREFVHCSRLFQRPPPHLVYEVKFSSTKFVFDLLRLLFFPFWLFWLFCAVFLVGVNGLLQSGLRSKSMIGRW